MSFLSCASVGLNDIHNLVKWDHTAEFSGVYHHTKFRKLVHKCQNMSKPVSSFFIFYEISSIRFSPLKTKK